MKSDVFSFGVLVLEIVSGKKSNDNRHSENTGDLLSFVSVRRLSVSIHYRRS